MRSADALPDAPVREAGPVSRLFRSLGLRGFVAAAQHVRSLPYGRTSDRRDPSLVLREGRGTCSGKHALLAVLAREQGLEIPLTLGIYAMHDANTPGVGTVLRLHGLDSIPEAHCYLRYQETRIDVTRSGVEAAEPIDTFLHEEAIAPEQVVRYKEALHRRFLRDWIGRTPAAQGLDLEQAWRIREACIAALSG